MSEEIMKRLRDWESCDWNGVIQLRKDAADRIEALEAERDAAVSLVGDMIPYCVARYSMTTGTQYQTERLRVRANDLLALRVRSSKEPKQ